jgi:hypothetical protein
MAEFDPVGMLRVLQAHHVRFVLIGGIAARLRGAPLLTEDVDITPDQANGNVMRLAAALRDLHARLRTTSDPDGVDFPIEPEMLRAGDSWTFTTRSGDLDLVFLPAGTRGYGDLARNAAELSVTGDGSVTVAVASLADVIRSKEAAGRDKDRAALPLLRRTLEETDEP